HRVPQGVDMTKGIAITSSFHPDETTHVENCRYGPGSNAMSGLATLLVPGDTGRSRPLQFLRDAIADPSPLFNLFPIMRRWSERAVILLVMQTADNSLTTSLKKRAGRWVLTSRQGQGEPNPTFIKLGHEAAKTFTQRLAAATGQAT